MSSALLETRLVPDPKLRRLALISGCFLLIAGLALVLHFPMAPAWRGLIIVAWVADVLREMIRMTAGAARVRLLRLDESGHIVAERPDGGTECLTLLTGSLVLRRFAWLRLRFPDNRQYAELICGDPAKDLEWQRLQLIWQQSGGTFARSG